MLVGIFNCLVGFIFNSLFGFKFLYGVFFKVVNLYFVFGVCIMYFIKLGSKCRVG